MFSFIRNLEVEALHFNFLIVNMENFKENKHERQKTPLAVKPQIFTPLLLTLPTASVAQMRHKKWLI